MNAIVVDASFAGLIILPDETTPELASALGDRLAEHPNLVPAHWHLEIASLLLKAQRQRRISTLAIALEILGGWRIEIDREGAASAWTETLALAQEHRLTAYDAAYLELAVRRRAALASVDGALVKAARGIGVDVLTAPE